MKKVALIVSLILTVSLIALVFGCSTPAPSPAPTAKPPAPPTSAAPAPTTAAPVPKPTTTAPPPAPTGFPANWPKALKLTTLFPGSSITVYGTAVAAIIEKYLKIPCAPENTASTVEMTMLMLQGKSHLATNNSPNAGYIMKNAAPWPADANKVYRGLTFGGYETLNQFLVRADSPIKTFADLKGKKGMVDRQGEPAFADVWPAVLEAYGTDKKDFTATPDLNIGSQATAIKENRTDVIMFYGAPPVPQINELSQTVPIRLLSHTDAGLKTVIGKLPWVASPHTMKAGTYKGQDADVLTLKFFLGVGVRSDVPDDLVYAMAKAIDEHIEELKATHASFKTWTMKDLANSPYGPYHAGAYKYYMEKGYLTQESIDKHKAFLKQVGMDK